MHRTVLWYCGQELQNSNSRSFLYWYRLFTVLLFVDGLPIDNGAYNPDDITGNVDAGNRASDISSDDGESINVLKGQLQQRCMEHVQKMVQLLSQLKGSRT